MKTAPYYRRILPRPQDYQTFNYNKLKKDWNTCTNCIIDVDMTNAHFDPYPTPTPTGRLPDLRDLANSLFDSRTAAAASASVGDPTPPKPEFGPEPLLEKKEYSGFRPFSQLRADNSLAAMAYQDYFPLESFGDPNDPVRLAVQNLRDKVSAAIMEALPGFCGTNGPNVSDQGSEPPDPSGNGTEEGNYDMGQMFALALVYNFYNELSSDARERLITLLLAKGRIHRVSTILADDFFTSGESPFDWRSAGSVTLSSVLPVNVDIPETENHILCIATARYLTNQLLYQRDNGHSYDNRRNGDPDYSRPNCMDQVVGLLRDHLRDDFGEYNAKSYQEETRRALLDLCSYAYDAEVRLGARMVLDYISAHFVTSSNDLRRMVPFRRRTENENIQPILDDKRNPIPDDIGFLDVGLLDDLDANPTGSDPIPKHFALLAGNLRAFQGGWALNRNCGHEIVIDALSSYRLPPSIHDLFVNDLSRRFFQRLHRYKLGDQNDRTNQHNADNMEIYSGSPSYLITAGGKPAPWVIRGKFGQGYFPQNLGCAVPTSFIPTGLSAWPKPLSFRLLVADVGLSAGPISFKAVAQLLGIPLPGLPCSLRQLYAAAANRARYLIQLSRFSMQAEDDSYGGTENYGVAPDFACGYGFHLPAWTRLPKGDGLFFLNRKSNSHELAGFFLAIIKQGDFIVMEAFDTWLNAQVSYEEFKCHVTRDNPWLHPEVVEEFQCAINDDLKIHPNIQSGKENVYTTYFGNNIHFVIWPRQQNLWVVSGSGSRPSV